MLLDGLSLLLTGGTGSLGQAIVRRIFTGELGTPRRIVVFSRDEYKQHQMKTRWTCGNPSSRGSAGILEYFLGDIRVYETVASAIRGCDVVVNAAALKQVPNCEAFPIEAVRTNVDGAHNIVRAIRELQLPVRNVVSISTDKACKPVSVMGMTKAIQERIFTAAAASADLATIFTVVRYGNVVGSRGSVLPYFKRQIRSGGPVTVTSEEMTRFLLLMDSAVDTVVEALRHGRSGETVVPLAPSARVADIARVLVNDRSIPVVMVGARPGEKIHELLINEEERHRTFERNGYYVIRSILSPHGDSLDRGWGPHGEYSSRDSIMSEAALSSFLASAGYVENRYASAVQ